MITTYLYTEKGTFTQFKLRAARDRHVQHQPKRHHQHQRRQLTKGMASAPHVQNTLRENTFRQDACCSKGLSIPLPPQPVVCRQARDHFHIQRRRSDIHPARDTRKYCSTKSNRILQGALSFSTHWLVSSSRTCCRTHFTRVFIMTVYGS